MGSIATLDSDPCVCFAGKLKVNLRVSQFHRRKPKTEDDDDDDDSQSMKKGSFSAPLPSL